MIRHLTANIDYLLEKDNDWLGIIFDGDGQEIRAELEERKANGEKLIPSENCEGFSPITGCPGHQKIEQNGGL